MKRSTGVRRAVAAAVVILPLAWPAARGEVRRDPRAVAVADAVERAIAPDGAWQKIAGLSFAFTVVKEGKTLQSHEHLWDTRTGRCRVEGPQRDGGRYLVIFNVTTKQGDAWTKAAAATEGGKGEGTAADSAMGTSAPWVKQDGEGSAKLLEMGYGRFINDTYWLLMPLKMKDPGVNLDVDGEQSIEGQPVDVVKLTFDGVGLTPGDTYWVYVNRKTHLVDRWDYVLEGQEAKDRASWLWKDWQAFGPLRLSTTKTKPDGTISIAFARLEALTEIPSGAFEPPR